VRDPRAFEAVFERHFDVVWRYACRRAGAQVADDVAAQTFVVAFDRRSRFRDGVCSARPWLLGIATNLLRRHRRTELTRLRAQAAAPIERSPGMDEAVDRATAATLAPVAARALAKLPRRDREILALLAWAELTYEQIAEALGIPVGTVRSRAHRARVRVRELLEAEAAITR
jgi:RNA polymerase sigma-70 factor (ECF subfamily)